MYRQMLRLALAGLPLLACDDADDPIVANVEPNAVISADTTGVRGIMVELDGSASSDPDGDALTYAWSVASRPAGSAATLSDDSSRTVTFVPDRTGTYTFALTVSDGDAEHTATHTVTIDVPTLGSIWTDRVIPNTSAPPGEADYRLSHTATWGANVTIEPGVAILMGAGSFIHVPGPGSLRAIGAPTLPIVFVGQDASPGYWDGLQIDSHSALNEFAYVDIAHGGGGDNRANVTIHGTVRIANSSFRGSSTYGVRVFEYGSQLPGFVRNRFDANELGSILIRSELIGSLDASTDYIGTTGSHVVVAPGVVETPQTWRALGTPYRVISHSATLTILSDVAIEPGVRFLMGEESQISVHPLASISAIGTAADSIVFAGDSPTAGHWYGIWIGSNAANSMSYVRVGHAGRPVGTFTTANIIVLRGTLTLSNSHIHDSETFGVAVADTATFIAADVTYANNASGDVHQQ